MTNGKEVNAGRPVMPEGYLYQHDVRLLPWSYVSERMEQSRSYWIATTRADGRPHVMPVWGVWLDEVFYFGTGNKRSTNINGFFVITQ